MTATDYIGIFTIFSFGATFIGMVMGINSTPLGKIWRIFFLVVGGYSVLFCIYNLNFVLEFGSLVWEDRENVAKINNPAKAWIVVFSPIFGILFGSMCVYRHFGLMRFEGALEAAINPPPRSDEETKKLFFAIKDWEGNFCKMVPTPDGGAIPLTWDSKEKKWVSDRISIYNTLKAWIAHEDVLVRNGVTPAPEIWEE
jgi:hypothetical protein